MKSDSFFDLLTDDDGGGEFVKLGCKTIGKRSMETLWHYFPMDNKIEVSNEMVLIFSHVTIKVPSHKTISDTVAQAEMETKLETGLDVDSTACVI